MVETERTFTAAQIAAALGKTPQAVRKVLRDAFPGLIGLISFQRNSCHVFSGGPMATPILV